MALKTKGVHYLAADGAYIGRPVRRGKGCLGTDGCVLFSSGWLLYRAARCAAAKVALGAKGVYHLAADGSYIGPPGAPRQKLP